MHFAIAYENSKLMKKLVECGANVHQRANGKFFLPIDQQWPIPRPKTNFEGNTYNKTYKLINLCKMCNCFGRFRLPISSLRNKFQHSKLCRVIYNRGQGTMPTPKLVPSGTFGEVVGLRYHRLKNNF